MAGGRRIRNRLLAITGPIPPRCRGGVVFSGPPTIKQLKPIVTSQSLCCSSISLEEQADARRTE